MMNETQAILSPLIRLNCLCANPRHLFNPCSNLSLLTLHYSLTHSIGSIRVPNFRDSFRLNSENGGDEFIWIQANVVPRFVPNELRVCDKFAHAI